MIKLSIIIPVYNVEQYLEKCLRSCLSQDIPYNEYEIIVVNDGSPDSSLAIAERIAESATNITIISQENGGLSAARNTGLKVAKGEYVWFVDSDDWIETNCLKQLTDTLYNDNLEALVINGIRVINGEFKKNPPRAFTNKTLTGIDYLNKIIINCAAVITIYKREILVRNNLNFMEGIYHEDAEFTPRAYYFINKIAIRDYHFYYNLLNSASITQTVNPKKGFDLIKVARSLYNFQKTIPHEHKNKYNKYISSAINQSLHNATQMKNKILKDYIIEFKNNRQLLKSLIKTQGISYKIEGLLFYLFPEKSVSIYKCFKNFKP